MECSVGLLGEGFLDFIPRNFMVHVAPHEPPPNKLFYKQSGIGLRLQVLTEELKIQSIPGSTREAS